MARLTLPKLIFHPDIQNEIRESYQWYESRALGLGEDFIAELESAFQHSPLEGENLMRLSLKIRIGITNFQG
jgi:hypothetical protein